MMKKVRNCTLASIICCGVLIDVGYAQSVIKELDLAYESPVLVRKGEVEISLADFVAYMDRRVPAAEQRELISSASRIESILENIALTDAFWLLANDEDLIENQFSQARLYQAAAREARDMYREKLQAEIELPDYEIQARELYLTEPDRFIRGKIVDIEQILVSVGRERDQIDGMKRVIEAHERLVSGEEFVSVAAAFSDDPTFDENQGLLTEIPLGDLVPSVGSAIASLEVGELSIPVQSRFGWHIVRLVRVEDTDLMTWEEAKPIAERVARERHLTESFERVLREINTAPMQFSDGAVRTILDHYGIDGFGIPELGQVPAPEDGAQ